MQRLRNLSAIKPPISRKLVGQLGAHAGNEYLSGRPWKFVCALVSMQFMCGQARLQFRSHGHSHPSGRCQLQTQLPDV